MTLAKLVLSIPPTQRKVKLRVKRFFETLVHRKTEFVFFFVKIPLNGREIAVSKLSELIRLYMVD